MSDQRQPEQREESFQEWAARNGFTLRQQTGLTLVVGGPKRSLPDGEPEVAPSSEPDDRRAEDPT